MARRLTTLAAFLTVAAALAGCAQNAAPGAPDVGLPTPLSETSIAREVVFDLSGADWDALLDTEDADAMLRELAEAMLVVRVAEAGVYTLAYTDASGHARQEMLGLVAPGAPRIVEGVDPLTDARLLRDDAVVYARPSLHDAWWHVGALPLGFWMEPGAASRYDYRLSSSSEFELNDYVGEEFRIDLARMTLELPIRGEAGWVASDDGADGTRLAFDVETAVDATQDILTFHFEGEANDTSGVVGMTLPPVEAWSKGGFSVWAENGEVTQARFDGASAAGEMRMLVWATGGFAQQESVPCPGGMAQDDPCEAFAFPRLESNVPAGDITRIDEREPEPMTASQTEAWSRAFDLMSRGFSQGFVVGDSLTIRGETEPADVFGVRQITGEMEYALSVAAREPVDVAAGSFDAYRLAQSVRIAVAADEIGLDFPVMRDLNVDETFSRSTIWLDAATYQPLRVRAESPLDADRLLHDLVGAVPSDTWDELGVPAPATDSYRWTVSGLTEVEARTIDGRQSYSPMMGLMLATTLSSGMPLMGLGFAGVSAMGPDADPVPEPFEDDAPTGPQHQLYVEENGAFYEGAKDYTVTWATEEFLWFDLEIRVDGALRNLDAEAGCATAHDAGVFTVCGGEDLEYAWTTIDAGDVIRLGAIEEGSTIEFIDKATNLVIASVVVG